MEVIYQIASARSLNRYNGGPPESWLPKSSIFSSRLLVLLVQLSKYFECSNGVI